MGLLGILSLLQIGIIPGILITAQIKSLSPFDRTLLVLPFSCIGNYFLVITLSLLGIYNQTSLIVILIVESATLILYAKSRMLQGSYALDLSALIDSEKKQNNIIRWLVILLLFFYTALTFKQIGTVFTDADVVQSWNKWAIDWFNGISPRNTFHYPQLIPALYSLTYQFIGSVEVEFFAKLVSAFFPIMMMLTFLRMASLNKQNSTLYLLVLILFWASFSRMMGSSSAFNGYADLPLAYFVLVTIYIFNLARVVPNNEQLKSNTTLLVLCAVVIAGGAITKHSALYLAAIMPLAWYFHFRQTATVRQIIMAYLVLLVIAGHWFIYKQIQIYSGGDSSEFQYLSGLVALPWYAKLWHGVAMVSSKISWLWIPLFIAGLLTPLGRAHAIWIFVPFFLLWSVFASYDYRNLILALPSLAFILASGMIKLHEHFRKTELGARIYRGVAMSVLLLCLSAILYMLSTTKIETDLIALNQTAKRAVGVFEFNEKLYAYFEEHSEPAMIATNYYAMDHLPVLKDRRLTVSCSELEPMAENRTARYVIVDTSCAEIILSSLAAKYKKIFDGRNLIFYEAAPYNMAKDSR